MSNQNLCPFCNNELPWNRRTPEPGTSVVRWTRCDGTPETLPVTLKPVLLKEVAHPKVSIIARYLNENGDWESFITDHTFGPYISSVVVGDLWAYLPTPPEGD